MIRHVAVFRFKDDVTDAFVDEIDEALATLPSIIPEIISFSSGRNADVTEGAWDYAVVSDFESPEDFAEIAEEVTAPPKRKKKSTKRGGAKG